MTRARKMIRARKFVPAAILLGSILVLAACKLTTTGAQLPSGPPSGSSTEYLFASSNNTVWSFTVDPTTGALGAATGVAGPQESEGLIGNPAGNYLYVTDSLNDQVDVYSISSTGVLAQITGSPYAVGTVSNGNTSVSAAGLTMDSTGKYLYAADYLNNAIAGFSITSSTGALTSLGAPFVDAGGPAHLIVDSTNKYLYASDYGSGTLGQVSAYTLNSSTGALNTVPGSPFTTLLNGGPFGLATTGDFLYVGESTANQVAALSITNGSGALTLINTPIAAGGIPAGVAVTPSGKYLYVANSADSTISGYSVDSTTGALTALNSGVAFAATSSPYYLTVDPSGAFLYATNINDGTISGFSINSTTGALTQFSGLPTAVGTRPTSLAVVSISQ